MNQQQTAFENIVGKEEITLNKQFLLFPQSFLLCQIIVSPFVHIFDIITLFAAELEQPKIDISGKGLTHSHRATPFDTPGKQAFRKHCGKRRNCS